ncbi:MAG TPA: hypothetical protein VJ697_11155 [Nitrososphaeraceae archaeon]|nr:hypothetical protein [Nitrososphaeraceae archaeon]
MRVVQPSNILLSLTISFTLIFIPILENQVFSIEYTNYTSEEHGIQFQYPTDWKINEKNSDLDSVPDIEISSDSISQEKIYLFHKNPILDYFGTSNIEEATYFSLKAYKTGLIENYVNVNDPPSSLSIDGHKALTFAITIENKYEKSVPMIGLQDWTVFVENHGYVLGFKGFSDKFDSSENTDIRNHFITSIRFI